MSGRASEKDRRKERERTQRERERERERIKTTKGMLFRKRGAV